MKTKEQIRNDFIIRQMLGAEEYFCSKLDDLMLLFKGIKTINLPIPKIIEIIENYKESAKSNFRYLEKKLGQKKLQR